MFLFLQMGGEQAPLGENDWRFARVFLAQQFPGWTLEYIDSLRYGDLNDIYAILDAQAKAK